MPGLRRAPAALPSDDWMLEQQVRAELEAEAWRRLRVDAAQAAPAVAPLPEARAEPDPHRSGSLTLKALVRFSMAAAGGYIAYLAAADSGLGEFEIWLAIGAAFIITLALSAFGPLRRLVHVLAETARWALIAGFAFGALWVMTQAPS